MIRSGEYKTRGEYHKNLDKNWLYYPVYVEKMKMVKNFLAERGRGKKILDLGCGEGALVEEMRRQGYDITGVDANYESGFVLKRDIFSAGFADNSFDIVLCLDVLEHLDFYEQERAIDEIKRMLKPEGVLVLTLPNLAHFASRFSFLFLGKLLRTSEIERHQGDRPIGEYLKLLKNKNFLLKKRKGLFTTLPLITLATYYLPGKVLFWHKLANKIACPNWSFLNFMILENKKYADS